MRSIPFVSRKPILLPLVAVLVHQLAAGFSSANLISESPAPQPSASAPQAVAAAPLELEKPVTRALSGGEKHSYQITLADQKYISLIIDQRGIDVLVRLFAPDGTLISDYDSAEGGRGQEDPEWVTQNAGNYTFEVAAKRKDAPPGAYEIKIMESRDATANDRVLLEARTLQREGLKLRFQEKYDQALIPSERALAIYERVLGPEHPKTAKCLYHIGLIHILGGDYQAAESFFQRATDIKERVLPPNDLTLALSLQHLGLVNLYRGNYERAEALLRRALGLFEVSRDDPLYPRIGHTLHSLAYLYKLRGEFSKHDAMMEQALATWEEAYGPESVEVARTLIQIGDQFRINGDYVHGEPPLLRALAIAEKAVGKDQATAGSCLEESVGALAGLYTDKGDYATAQTLLTRQESVVETLGPTYPFLPDFLDTLASFNQGKGDFAKAEQLSLRAIAFREQLNGPDHFLVAMSLSNLGALYYRWGEYDKAEAILQRALAISKKALGVENPTTASILDALGKVYRSKGNYQSAEGLFREALATEEKLFGPTHPEVGKTLDNLATLFAAKGDGAQALAFQTQANDIDERSITLNLATGSEREKLIYLGTLSDKLDKTISLQVQFAPDDRSARDHSMTMVIQRKGRVQDAVANNLSNLRRRLAAPDQEALRDLNATNAQLAQLILEGAKAKAMTTQLQAIKTLEERADKLEAEISRRSAGAYQPPQPATLEAVRSAIPERGALVELITYRPFSAQTADAKAFREPHYGAYVLPQKGDVQWTDLGRASAIDHAIGAFRDALRDPRRKDVQALARAVDAAVMQPLRDLLGDATHLLISPDGELNLIPFEGLVDERSRYLVERYSFTYLTSGRDLLRMRVARKSKSDPVALANPAFGESPAKALSKTNGTMRSIARRNRRRSVTTGNDMSDVYFAPLGGTEQEAHAIQTLFPDLHLLTGASANESALKGVDAPRILHIATHGFFLEFKANSSAQNAESSTKLSNPAIANPLLRSGLALAGANQGGVGRGEDGILTALEASGLNLWGTKLAVVSACDTGVGEVRNGEGVYGLRRAFVLAGAETLVMSLWAVSDYSTRRLMADYYKNLKQGLGRGEALRAVQLQLLKTNPKLHPFYWANFIQIGEWSGLAGER